MTSIPSLLNTPSKLVRGQVSPSEISNLFEGRGRVRSNIDDDRYLLSPFGIWETNHRAIDDAWMTTKHILDLKADTFSPPVLMMSMLSRPRMR
jgi:hypothetical protein